MPSEGFEGEILNLMKKMEVRKEMKENVSVRRKKVGSSKFERELRKLECLVNFRGARGNCGDYFRLQMNLRILSWNVRGANNKEKRKIIKALIKPQRVDLVCLQKTKIQEMNVRIMCILNVDRCQEWEAMNSRGIAGGVLVFWDNRVLQLIGLEVGNFSISCKFKNYEDEFCWIFTGVHGPTLRREGKTFGKSWGQLRVFGVTLGV